MNQNNIKHIRVSAAAINFLELPLATGGEKVRELIKALLENEDIEDRKWQLEKINKDFSLWYVPQGGPGKASGHGLLNINRNNPDDIFNKTGMEYGWEIELGEDRYDFEYAQNMYFGFDKNGKFMCIVYAEWVKQTYPGDDQLMVFIPDIPMDKSRFLSMFGGHDGIISGLYGRYGPWENWAFI